MIARDGHFFLSKAFWGAGETLLILFLTRLNNVSCVSVRMEI